MVIQVNFDPLASGTCPMDTMGWPNLMMHARASRAWYPEHIGPLSIKTVSRGKEHYNVSNQRYAVTPDSYLILNHGQYYASQIKEEEEIESFCIFFTPGLADEVLNGLQTPDRILVDDPEFHLPHSTSFVEKLYRHDTILSPYLSYLRDATLHSPVTNGWLEEQYRFLLERLILLQHKVQSEISEITSIRYSTRVELYCRIHRAKDFIDATLHQQKTIPEIAAVACLSPHYFLRLFKQVTGLTPHRYISHQRMEHACVLLKRTESPVAEICREVGFESLGTFSRVFRERYGCSPTMYRRQSR